MTNCPYCDEPLDHNSDGGIINNMHAACYESYGKDLQEADLLSQSNFDKAQKAGLKTNFSYRWPSQRELESDENLKNPTFLGRKQ